MLDLLDWYIRAIQIASKGTNSVKLALEKLLDGPCYHMPLVVVCGECLRTLLDITFLHI